MSGLEQQQEGVYGRDSQTVVLGSSIKPEMFQKRMFNLNFNEMFWIKMYYNSSRHEFILVYNINCHKLLKVWEPLFYGNGLIQRPIELNQVIEFLSVCVCVCVCVCAVLAQCANRVYQR